MPVPVAHSGHPTTTSPARARSVHVDNNKTRVVVVVGVWVGRPKLRLQHAVLLLQVLPPGRLGARVGFIIDKHHYQFRHNAHAFANPRGHVKRAAK